MILRRPPKIAAWLIERNSPLAGDLLEEFQRGKSRGWFWRQTLIASTAGWGRNIRASQLYLKAYLIGFTAQAPVAFILWRFHLLNIAAWPACLLLGATTVSIRKITGPVRRDLSSIVAEYGESDSRKRTAIAVLVGLRAFTAYLSLYRVGVTMYAFFFWLDVLKVVFRRIDSGQGPRTKARVAK